MRPSLVPTDLHVCFFSCLLFSFLFVSGLIAGETNVFHSGFEAGDADLTDGSGRTATDSAWVDDGVRQGTDTLVGDYQGDVLVEDYACKLVKHAGTGTLFAHADAGGDRDSLHVGLWFQLESWDAYDVARGHTTDIFSLWDQGLSTQAVRVMIAGDYQRSLLVEFRDGSEVVTLGTEELEYTSYSSTPIEAGAQEGSLYLDSGRWYYLELFYRSDGTNGGVELRVDGGLRLYRYGADTSSRPAGALILGARPFEDTSSTMTFLFDDVDIGLFDDTGNDWVDPGDIHSRTHPDSLHNAGIPLVVDFGSEQGSFAANFQRRFLQMNAEVETDALYDIIVSSNTATGYTYPKYQRMGIAGVRFVATGFDCAFGNPQVTGKAGGGAGTYGTFTFDFGRLEDLVAGVSDSIGASLRIGLGKSNVVMQCLECFEYENDDTLSHHWSVTDPSAQAIGLTYQNQYERAKALKITVESTVDPSDAVVRTVTGTADSNWLVASGQTQAFDLWLAAGQAGSRATFFVVSEGDSAFWGGYAIPKGSYAQFTLDLTSPTRQTGGWQYSMLGHVDSFGLIDLHADRYPAKFFVDWLRLPRTGWYPYDGSLTNVRLDWWRQYCDEAIKSIKSTLGPDTLGLVLEGWNESDRWYTTTGDTARLRDVLDIYRVTAHSFAAQFPNGGPQMASLGVTNPKEDVFIRAFLDMVRDSSLAMDLFATHTYKGSPNTVLEVMETARAVLDSNGYTTTPIYNSAYMDYFTQDFRKDTNHRAAQWLTTMLKLEEANREEGLNVWGVTTYGYTPV
jgi:hypothetical protein